MLHILAVVAVVDGRERPMPLLEGVSLVLALVHVFAFQEVARNEIDRCCKRADQSNGCFQSFEIIQLVEPILGNVVDIDEHSLP